MFEGPGETKVPVSRDPLWPRTKELGQFSVRNCLKGVRLRLEGKCPQVAGSKLTKLSEWWRVRTSAKGTDSGGSL